MKEIEAFRQRTAKPIRSEFNLHIHDTCEILCFLEGNADYFVEGSIYPLRRGDLIITRQSEAHHLILNNDAEYERMVVNFSADDVAELDADGKIHEMFFERPIGKYNHFSASLFPENKWMYYLDKLCSTNLQKRRLIYLYALLDEMSENFDTVKQKTENVSQDKTVKIIQYIERHLYENITIDSICRRFFISQPQLNRVFKKATGSTVWNYVTAKRMNYAKELLQKGIQPTKVPELCGYVNYVSFYKAYKKAYGISPSYLKNK